MRVIGGSRRGQRLRAPASRATRPTSDRVREAVFDILGSILDLSDARALDLFAGSGAMGIEALSRGAAHATLVEQDRRALATLRSNLAATGLGAHATVVASDALRWLAQRPAGEEFEVAFVDPPYAFSRWSELLALLPATLAVLESDRPLPLEPDAWSVVREKRYGGTLVTVIARVPPASSPAAPPVEGRADR